MIYSPVFEMLKKYTSQNADRYHMPGHKGEGVLFDGVGADLVKMDVTELDFTDNILNPQNAFLEAQSLMTKRCKSLKSFFLSGGSTQGNHTMIMSSLKEGEKILVDRFCHISVLSALALSGATPVFIENEYADECGVLGCVSEENLKKAVAENPDAKAVFVTSPNSYGQVSPLREISKICRKNNMLLLVDEAHGAHFPFSDMLPESAMEQGADASVISYHKTIPSLTQCAVLNIGNPALLKKAEETLHMLITSSSSFLLMASIDYGRAYMEDSGKENMEKLIKLIKENAPKNVLKTDDVMRIVVRCDGEKSLEILREEKIEPEMYGNGLMVFIVTAADSEEKVLRLLKILEKLPETDFKAEKIPHGKLKMTPREAYYAESELCHIDNALGKISKKAIYAYPPGVAAVLPGSIIDEDAIKFIKNNNLIGKQDNQIEIII